MGLKSGGKIGGEMGVEMGGKPQTVTYPLSFGEDISVHCTAPLEATSYFNDWDLPHRPCIDSQAGCSGKSVISVETELNLEVETWEAEHCEHRRPQAGGQ